MNKLRKDAKKLKGKARQKLLDRANDIMRRLSKTKHGADKGGIRVDLLMKGARVCLVGASGVAGYIAGRGYMELPVYGTESTVEEWWSDELFGDQSLPEEFNPKQDGNAGEPGSPR